MDRECLSERVSASVSEVLGSSGDDYEPECSVFITALIIVSVVSINNVIC